MFTNRGESGPAERMPEFEPALSPPAPSGATARQLNVRVPAEPDSLVARYVQTQVVRSESELVRNALVEYFNNHKIPA